MDETDHISARYRRQTAVNPSPDGTAQYPNQSGRCPKSSASEPTTNWHPTVRRSADSWLIAKRFTIVPVTGPGLTDWLFLEGKPVGTRR